MFVDTFLMFCVLKKKKNWNNCKFIVFKVAQSYLSITFKKHLAKILLHEYLKQHNPDCISGWMQAHHTLLMYLMSTKCFSRPRNVTVHIDCCRGCFFTDFLWSLNNHKPLNECSVFFLRVQETYFLVIYTKPAFNETF